MQLLNYWQIVRRRGWIILVLLVAVAASHLLMTPRPAPSYSAAMRFVVGLRPEPGTGDYYTYDRYYTWLTAEYLLDDLAEIVKSQAFAQDVAQRSGQSIPAGVIQSATSAGKLHRILSVSITWPNPDELTAIAEAAAQVLEHDSARYFAQLATENAVVAIIDPPSIGQIPASLRQRLDLPLRLILAAIAGLGLTFLLHYLDQSLRTGQELEQLGLTVLAEIPPHANTRWPQFGRRNVR